MKRGFIFLTVLIATSIVITGCEIIRKSNYFDIADKGERGGGSGSYPPKCGDIIKNNLRLYRNIKCIEGNGLIVGTDNIVLDCNGHSITGSWNTTYEITNGILIDGFKNITIKNCKVSNFYYGIHLIHSNNSIIHDTISVSNPEGYGVILEDSNNNYIYNNIFELNEFGLEFAFQSTNNIVENITTSNNTVGIAFYRDSTHNNGFNLNSSQNELAGLYFVDYANFNEITNSVSLSNLYDLYVSNSYNLTLTNITCTTVYDDTHETQNWCSGI